MYTKSHTQVALIIMNNDKNISTYCSDGIMKEKIEKNIKQILELRKIKFKRLKNNLEN